MFINWIFQVLESPHFHAFHYVKIIWQNAIICFNFAAEWFISFTSRAVLLSFSAESKQFLFGTQRTMCTSRPGEDRQVNTWSAAFPGPAAHPQHNCCAAIYDALISDWAKEIVFQSNHTETNGTIKVDYWTGWLEWTIPEDHQGSSNSLFLNPQNVWLLQITYKMYW